MLTTIGYEKSTLSDFIATLQLCNIDILVDIRDRAQSRRPGFSKTALSEALKDAGIEYIHYKSLGDPKEGREAARSGNYPLFKKIFNQVMDSEIGQKSLSEVKDLAINNSICLMCYERDQKECHRKIVSDHLETVLNCKAQHIGVQKDASKQTTERRMLHTH